MLKRLDVVGEIRYTHHAQRIVSRAERFEDGPPHRHFPVALCSEISAALDIRVDAKVRELAAVVRGELGEMRRSSISSRPR